MNIHWYPGHMQKTKRLISEQLKLVDLVLVLYDARAIKASKNPLIEMLIKDKKKLIVITKYDLCDKEKLNKELEFLDAPYVILNSLKDNVSAIIKTKAQELLADKIKKFKEKGILKRNLRLMIVGNPNVGKSTLINSLIKKNYTKVENRPGVTQNINWVRIHKDLDLLDTPGVLWPKLENQDHAARLALIGSIKMDIINKEELCLYGLRYLIKYYNDKLIDTYGINCVNEIDFINELAHKYKFYLNSKDIDYNRTYEFMLSDIRNAKIKNISFDYE